VVDAFPLTGSGKIQKFKLRESWAKGELTAL
jgi:fatty-acyl-CoA synthase